MKIIHAILNLFTVVLAGLVAITLMVKFPFALCVVAAAVAVVFLVIGWMES